MKLSSFILAGTLLASTLGFADYYYQPTCEPSCVPEPTCCPSGKIILFGDYLYWQVSEDQLSYAEDLNGGITPIIDFFSGDAVVLNETMTVKDVKFQYKSGFRVGIGYQSSSDWDFDLYWTRLHEKTHSSITDPDFGILPTSFPITIVFNISATVTNPMFISGASAKWRFHFDTIDFELGKTFNPACNLHLKPFVGVKGARINQRIDIDYDGIVTNVGPVTAPILAEVLKKNNFWGIGPSFGLDTFWDFGDHWRLFGELSLAPLYGKFKTTLTPSLDVPLIGKQFNVALKHHVKRIRPTIDGKLGINWHVTTCSDWLFRIGVAYEVEYWWNQWQVPSSLELSTFNGNASPQGDLMMQGLTLHAAIGF